MNFSQTGKTCEISTPGHAVDKDPPANVIDMGFMPGPGRSHKLWINEVCAPHLLSLSAATAEAHVPRAGAPREATTVRSMYSAVKSRPCSTRELVQSNEDTVRPEIDKT